MIKLSDYSQKDKKKLKTKMDELEKSGENWSIKADKADEEAIEILKSYDEFFNDPHSDFEHLESIEVDTGVSGFRSVNGCLVGGNGHLLFAPKCKRTTDLLHYDIKGIATERCGYMEWNKFCSKALRTNITEFARKDYYSDPYKKYVENLLMLYKENIYSIFENTLFYPCDLNPFDGKIYDADDIKLREITLSGDIIVRHRKCELVWKDGIIAGRKIDFDDDTMLEHKPDVDNNDSDIKRETDKILKNINKGNDIHNPVADTENDNPDSNVEYDEILLGVYKPDRQEIILYVEAMKLYGKKGSEFEDFFLSVLIHEFFHAVHHTYSSKFEYKKYDIIIEALADAFRYLFCKSYLKNDKLAQELKETWENISVMVYPYSGAKGIVQFEDIRFSNVKRFMNFNNISTNELVGIDQYDTELFCSQLQIQDYFKKSIMSMEKAQLILLSVTAKPEIEKFMPVIEKFKSEIARKAFEVVKRSRAMYREHKQNVAERAAEEKPVKTGAEEVIGETPAEPDTTQQGDTEKLKP